ncbi:MAG: hypothetical protein LIO75_09815 [Lachnospiraceae bacterium]|nr:hypothetical protein [Lachnospiraceae bacterium]
MERQILEHVSLRVSGAIRIRDAFSGKAVTNGIQIRTGGGGRTVLKPGGFCLFLNMETETFDAEITSAIYQSRRLVLEADGGRTVQDVFLYPSAAYPAERNTTVVSGHAHAGAMLYFHLEEERMGFRLLRDCEKGAKEISIFTGGRAGAVSGLWFIRDHRTGNGMYVRAPEPENETALSILPEPLGCAYRKKDAVLYPAIECMAGEDGEFYLFLNHLKEQSYQLFYSCMQDKKVTDGKIEIRGCSDCRIPEIGSS